MESTDQPTHMEISLTYGKTGAKFLLHVQDNDDTWWISKWSDYFTIPSN